MFLRIFKERLTDNFVQGCDDEIHSSSRANTYKLLFYTVRPKLSIAPIVSLKNEGSFPIMNIFLFYLLE